MKAPRQIAVDAGGDLYVADSGNDRISVFGGDGSFLRAISGGMDEPQDVAFGSGGRVFVADKGNDLVDVFTTAGEFLYEIGETELEEPTGLAVDGPTVYVADSGHNRVVAFSTAGGAGTPVASIPSARDVIVGADGNLYIADFGNKRIDVYSKAGSLVRFFGGSVLSGPVALASNGAGEIYVADSTLERVERFTEAGVFLGGFAAEPNVAGVAAACGGNVFATEESASLARVVRFGEPGAPPPPCTPPEPEPIVDPGAKPPSNKFRFAGLLKNRANGFAVLLVRVPGSGKLSLTGRGFRRLARSARSATTVRLPVKPKVRLRRYLAQHGKGRIRVTVTFTPLGGEPRKREKVIVLRRRR